MKEKIAKHTFYLMLILLGIFSIPNESHGAPDGDGLAADIRRVSSTTMEFYMPPSEDHPILEDNGEKYYATYSVSGKVVDENGEPLIGVNIRIKDTNQGTSTDFDGLFTLEYSDENAILIVSYIGYQTQEIMLSGISEIEVTMISDSQLLGEIVVVGYGTQSRKSLTSSISTINPKELTSVPSTSIGNNLGGRASGVMIKQSSGEPGSDGAAINLRGLGTIGSSAPLTVVDGIPRGFQDLNPNDIAEITILKDAAAVAPYGVAGANG